MLQRNSGCSVSSILYLGVVDRELRLHQGRLGSRSGSRTGDVDGVDLAGSVSGRVVDWSSRGVIGGAGVGGSLVTPMVGQLGVGGRPLVGDLGDVATVGVGTVLHVLDPAVREGHGVGAHHDPLLVLALHLVELGAAVGVAHSVLVGVGSVWSVVVNCVVAFHLKHTGCSSDQIRRLHCRTRSGQRFKYLEGLYVFMAK